MSCEEHPGDLKILMDALSNWQLQSALQCDGILKNPALDVPYTNICTISQINGKTALEMQKKNKPIP